MLEDDPIFGFAIMILLVAIGAIYERDFRFWLTCQIIKMNKREEARKKQELKGGTGDRP